MYILYHKEFYIVKEELTPNRTCQTWRGKQIAMCAEKKPLQEWIDKQPKRYRDEYFIEPDGATTNELERISKEEALKAT